jgi:hypothetical protein
MVRVTHRRLPVSGSGVDPQSEGLSPPLTDGTFDCVHRDSLPTSNWLMGSDKLLIRSPRDHLDHLVARWIEVNHARYLDVSISCRLTPNTGDRASFPSCRPTTPESRGCGQSEAGGAVGILRHPGAPVG